MKEIEVKVLESPRAAFLEKLENLGATLNFEGELDAILFEDANQTISARKDLLRLRREGDKNVLTYKKFISDEGAKIRKEYEVEVSDFETLRTILDLLGLKEVKRMRKVRWEYKLDGVKIVFDRYLGEMEFIPEFMELEGPDIPGLEKTAQKLGISPSGFLTWNTHDLIRHYGAAGS